MLAERCHLYAPDLRGHGKSGWVPWGYTIRDYIEDIGAFLREVSGPAIATGIAAILAVIFLILMFTVSISLGTINDVLNSITGLSSAVFAWILYAEHHVCFQKSPDFYHRQNTEVS